jgi:hypothetical protein
MKLRIFVAAALAMCLTSTTFAADPQEIERKVNELNSNSMKLLGVSLNALHYLARAKPGDLLLLSHLERSGEINAIRELEGKQYVTSRVVEFSPDGRQKDKFLSITPIGAGTELQRCVLALQHNSASQPTR